MNKYVRVVHISKYQPREAIGSLGLTSFLLTED